MTAAEILNLAHELDLEPSNRALQFAHAIAEECARIAERALQIPGKAIRIDYGIV